MFQVPDCILANIKSAVQYSNLGDNVILELYIHIQIRTMQLLIFTEKFSPLPGFEPGPPRYQADMLPIELSWLG